MGEAFIAFRDDPELRVAIVTGAGERFFSAGWDLKAYVAGDPGDPEAFGPGGLAGLTELFDLDKPVIAAVNGYAAGGGFELALACDLIVAAPEARFSLPEVKLGFVADSGGIFRLPRRMPRALAMELLLTGEPIDAAEAERWGLVNRVVAPERAAATGAARWRRGSRRPRRSRPARSRRSLAATEGMTVEQGVRGACATAASRPTTGRWRPADAEEGPQRFRRGPRPRLARRMSPALAAGRQPPARWCWSPAAAPGSAGRPRSPSPPRAPGS